MALSRLIYIPARSGLTYAMGEVIRLVCGVGYRPCAPVTQGPALEFRGAQVPASAELFLRRPWALTQAQPRDIAARAAA